MNIHQSHHGLRSVGRGGWVLFWCLWLAWAGAGRADQYDTLRLYWQNQLTGTNLSSSTLTSRAGTANGYWTTLVTNATRTNLWSDLPLGSDSAYVTSTFGRLQAMALAWATPGCSLQGDTNLSAAITNSLDWMVANCYTATATEYNNWWDWEIGGMQDFNNAALLVYPALTGPQITNYNNAVDHFAPPTKSWYTGANLTDQCKGMFIRAIIGKNAGKMTDAQTNLNPVFPYVTTGDGFYTDGSFRQHTVIAYTGTYGIVLLGDIQQLVNLLNGSAWQITDPKLTNVYNWVVHSYEPVIYHGAMMDMVRGRAISRSGETEFSDGGSAVNDINAIAQFAPAATAALFTNWTAAPAEPPGQYQFADMDRAVAWRSNFCLGLSMSSSRIANYESINTENLHGWFLGDGMTYLYEGNPDTQFTGDFWPTVDMYHLPGTTVAEFTRANSAKEATTTGQTWVGGAQVANSYGVAGMQLAAAGTTLVGKKSWFMFDNETVCLGAGVTSGGGYEVDTTVEDRRLGTSPTNHFTVDGTAFSPTMGWSSNLTSAAWCALDGVGGYYFPAGATNLRAAFVTNTGSWNAINSGYSTNLYTDDYLTLWFNHGINPTNATYAYVLLPNFTAGGMAAYAASPDITVLTNNGTIQAVTKPSLGVVAANFWADGTNTADLIKVNRKASVITLENSSGISVGVVDPTQTNSGTITVTLNRSALSTLSADAGVTVVQLSPQIVLSVNVSGSLGKTYQAVFTYPTGAFLWDANPSPTGTHPLDGGGTWSGGGTNWWNSSVDMPWNATTNYLAVFGAGGTAGTVTLTGAVSVASLTFDPVGGGTYTLGGPGPLTVSNGMAVNASATVSVPLTLPASQTWTLATNAMLTVNGPLAAPTVVALSLAGPGTLNLGGTNQLSTNITAVNFTDLANRTVLAISAGPAAVATLGLPDGVTGTVTGGGSLTVNSPASWGVGSAASGSRTLNLSGLAGFNLNASNDVFTVGGQSSGVTGSGALYLAATSSITAATFGVQTVTGGTSTQSSGALYLGQSTTIHASTVNVGLTRDIGTIQYEAGVTNPVLVIRAADGVSGANMTVGNRSSSYFSSATSTVDLNNNVAGTSTLDALLGALQIANEAYCLTASDVLTGNFIMGGGSLTATNITIAMKSNSSSQGIGTVNGVFTQTGGTVKAVTLTLGDRTAGDTNTLNATYNLAGGTLNAQTITPGNGAATRNLNWTNGVIGNYDANTDLAIAGGLNVSLSAAGTETFAIGSGRLGTVNAVLTGAGGLVAGGSGTLVLTATNVYTGTTTAAAGTLLVAGALGTNAVTVQAGATLGGAGLIAGPVTVQSGGNLQAGNAAGAGTLTVGALGLGSGTNSLTATRFNLAAGGLIAAAALTVLGTNTITILDTNLTAGTNLLLTYTGGTIGGRGLGGFQLASLPAGMTGRLTNTASALELVVTPGPVVSTNIPVLTNLLSAGILKLSWPADHTGWRLLMQTNHLSAGLSSRTNDWGTVTNSTVTNQISLPVNPAQPAEFYRLVYP